ncbi:MAG: LacI family DNA-binding transcriptional regulator [Anaerolineales bacterium]
MPKTQQTTIKEIAEETGVSKQTVSRVLNHRLDVSLEIRQRLKHKPGAWAFGGWLASIDKRLKKGVK